VTPPSRQPTCSNKDQAAKRPALHLHIGQLCNNDCLFCFEEDRELRFVVNSAMTLERATEILSRERQVSGLEEVVFTSGEPTLLESLPQLVSVARALEYRNIALMTNGRRLGHPGYLASLVEAGLNQVQVGLHGGKASTHDGITSSEGSFQQTLRGLEALSGFSRGAIQLSTSTVMVRENLAELSLILELASRVGAQTARFEVLQASGRVLQNFERLFPSYPEVVKGLKELPASIDRGPKIEVHGLPPCASLELPFAWVQALEPHRSVEVDDGMPSAQASGCGKPSADGRFVVIESEQLLARPRIKRSECKECSLEDRCPGVEREYISHFGWSQLDPVTNH